MGGRFCALFAALAVFVFFVAPDAHSGTHSRKHAGRHSKTLKHRVKRGETLYGIANTYGLGVDELKRANHIRGNVITAGGVLKIPRHHALDAKNAVHEDTPSPMAVHIVEGGETLYSLGRRYNVELAELRRLNHIRGNNIKVGQALRIPGAAGPVAAADGADAVLALAEAAPQEEDAPEMREDVFSDVKVWDIEKLYERVPYRFGGSGMDGIDCSGFTKSVFDSFGLTLPRSAREQFLVGMPVDKSELRRGDLVFFSTYAKYPSHVGIYVGDGRFMHMSTSKRMVEITDLFKGYYASNYLGARRVMPVQ